MINDFKIESKEEFKLTRLIKNKKYRNYKKFNFFIIE